VASTGARRAAIIRAPSTPFAERILLMTPREPDLRLFIDGDWLSAGHRRTVPVLNPATERPIGELPLADAADLDRALAAAERAFAQWRNSTADERARVLKGAAALLRDRVELIAAQATAEEGKPLAESRGETIGSANLLEFYAEECRRGHGRVLVRPSGMRSLVTLEPVGPIAAFAPWNFPLHNPARKLGAPVAAGCSVIMKPAEEAPASALHVAHALVDAGLPPGVVQIVFGVPDEVSRHLLASPIVRQVSFTGSTAVGKHLMRLAADQAQRTTMELGGHAPVIVFDDADIEAALDMLVRSKFRNAGQVCISPTRFSCSAASTSALSKVSSGARARSSSATAWTAACRWARWPMRGASRRWNRSSRMPGSRARSCCSVVNVPATVATSTARPCLARCPKPHG
jgi:succinate-semialdehyde dehydrogenase/glutarate-semialdehyde dehydrogenase